MLDVYLSAHVATLYSEIRKRALVQVCVTVFEIFLFCFIEELLKYVSHLCQQ